MRPSHIVIKPPPAQNRRKRGGKAEVTPVPPEVTADNLARPEDNAPIAADSDTTYADTNVNRPPGVPEVNSVEPLQISLEEALADAANKEPAFDTTEGNN